jgi:hypothetical protein
VRRWSGASGATDVGGRRNERNGAAAPGTEREGKPEPTTYAVASLFPDRRSASWGGGRDVSEEWQMP